MRIKLTVQSVKPQVAEVRGGETVHWKHVRLRCESGAGVEPYGFGVDVPESTVVEPGDTAVLEIGRA